MRLPLLSSLLVLLFVISGCGGGGQPIVVTLSPSTAQSVVAGQTVPLTAALTHDSKNAGVSWTLSGPGALSGQTTTAATYTAPSPIAAAATATVTATAVSDSKKSASLTINLQPVAIALSPSAAQTLDQTQTLSVTASVSNDPQTKGVTWSLSPTSGAGTLSGQTATSVTYNAPASVTSNTPVTLTATSVFDNTKNIPLTINLVPPPSITTTSLAAGQVGTAYSGSLTAQNGLTPYTWSVTSGALPGGLTLSGNTISGTPTTTGTFNFAVQVKDAGNLTATANLSITVGTSACGSGSESMLNGQYAFVLKGFDSSGNPALLGGILDFNGTGGITAGVIDENLSGGVSNWTVASGSYSVGSDQRGCMTVNITAPTHLPGQYNFRFSLGNITSGVASTAHVIDFDATGPFTAGRMYKQVGAPFTASQLIGTFAFEGSSAQNATQGGGKFAVAGLMTFSTNGLGLSISGSEDTNDNGTLDGSLSSWPGTSPISFNSTGSSYTVLTNGHGTLTLAVVGSASIFHSILYVVSTSQVLFMTSDAQTTANIVAGEAFRQSGTPFAATPLSGTYIGYDSGLGSGAAGTTRTDIILLGPLTSGSSTLTGTQLRNDAGVFSSSAISGTYSVSSTGRLLVSGGGGHEPVLYLVSPTQAFFLNGNSGVDSGFFESQSGGPFSNATASGTYAYGTIDPEAVGTGVNSGVAVFADPNLNTTEDDNSNGTLTVGSMQSSTYSVDSTGLGHIPATCTPGTNCQTLFYIISSAKAVVMDATSTNPKIQIADK